MGANEMQKRGSKRSKLSKRNYYKKIYWTADKDDLRKSFPKWTMVAWAIIDIAVGLFLYRYSVIFTGIFFLLAYHHLSYLWGGQLWGPSK